MKLRKKSESTDDAPQQIRDIAKDMKLQKKLAKQEAAKARKAAKARASEEAAESANKKGKAENNARQEFMQRLGNPFYGGNNKTQAATIRATQAA